MSLEFKTKADVEALERADGVVRKAEETRAVRQRELDDEEAACVADPSATNFGKAKAARRALEDAARDVELASAHAGSVKSIVSSNEQKAMRAESSRLERSLTEVADTESREIAVELVLSVSQLLTRLDSRRERRLSELAELNQLRTKIGEPPVEIPSREQLSSDAFRRVAEIGLCVQRILGIHPDKSDWGHPHMNHLFPRFRVGGASDGPKEYRRGVSTAFRGDEERDRVCDEAESLLRRVQERRSSLEGARGGGIASSLARCAAVALAVSCALGVVGG